MLESSYHEAVQFGTVTELPEPDSPSADSLPDRSADDQSDDDSPTGCPR